MSAHFAPRPALAAFLVAALLGGGCAVDPRYRVKTLEDEHRILTAATQAADQSIQTASTYAAELASPGQAGSTFSLYYTPAMLEQLSTQMLPYRAPGRDFHSKLTGEIVIERLTGFRFISRNRVLCQAHLRGVDVRYTGKVPSFAKGQVKEFQRNIAQGAVAELEVQLTLDRNTVRAKAVATALRMKAGRDASSEGMLQDEMNRRALRTPILFDLSLPGGQAPSRLMVTGNHVVVTYKP